ncbi:MAG: hypothetical protein HYX76_07600, partial [Acidobacteria bacterium]|nr:hypothetical protein [Acidobacteriota bacterium]
SPTPAEPELLALPPPFYPLYYVLRPIRLISQHGASLVRRARRAP